MGLFELGEYSGRNSLQIGSTNMPPVRITVPKGRYNVLRWLLIGGNGATRLPVRLEYADGSADHSVVLCGDWFTDPEEGLEADLTPVWNGMDRMTAGGDLHFCADPALFEFLLPVRENSELVAVVLDPSSVKFSTRVAARFNLLALTAVYTE